METEKHYRHELKYQIPYADYVAMRTRLLPIMQRDPHTSADGFYRIRSIYFDNGDDKALREKADGIGRPPFRVLPSANKRLSPSARRRTRARPAAARAERCPRSPVRRP